MADTRFSRQLRDRIADQQAKRAAFLASGGAADYSIYRETVGYIRGLEDILVLCNEIEQENQ